MARIIIIIFLATIKNICVGQHTFDQTTRLMSYEDNLCWLKQVRSFDRPEQWSALKKRLFSDVLVKDSSASFCPILVVNGVSLNFPDRIRDTDREQLTTLLEFRTLKDFQILETLNEKLIVCKPFAGVVIVQLDDKANKKLGRLMVAMSK